jgi:hypothetical protein
MMDEKAGVVTGGNSDIGIETGQSICAKRDTTLVRTDYALAGPSLIKADKWEAFGR